jgi:transcriptional regulator with XRE-family HTH domain
MTVSDEVAARVRQWRKRRGWKPADLAARCAELGAPDLTENIIENIESRSRRGGTKRPRPVTVDELLVLALALDIAPVNLLADTDDQAPCQVTPAVSVRAVVARRWMRGWPQSEGLPGITDSKRYLGATPDSEDDVEYLTRGEYARVRHILEPGSEDE